MELYQKKSETSRKNEILVWSNGSPSPFTALKNIRRKAKTLLEETGVNVAYMAFGFIHWRESESSPNFSGLRFCWFRFSWISRPLSRPM